MTVNGVSGVGAGIMAGSPGMSQASDPVSKNLQRQIDEAQKKLQELSSNTDMSSEEKMKKRQELQKTISDLSIQLRQHQIEERRAKQQKQESFDDMLGGEQKVGKDKAKGQNTGISQASMEAMISADVAMGAAKVQGSVATKMEGRAGVLKAEIALDSSRGNDVSAKQEELADVENKAMDAVSSQMSSLATAVENASKADENTEAEKSEEKKAEEEEKETEGSATEDAVNAENAAQPEIPQSAGYMPVDVRV